MTMECLRHFARQKLPRETFEVAQIDALRALRDAELIMAFIPPRNAVAHDGVNDKPATVLAITKKGRLVLLETPQLTG
ncbi:hypothetical protein J2W25_001989 [Variovorax boronicumulans]|uniref:Uncharacterized protein n=1 Tax=Variovorax boronicumulans TaxID=436515 RepID=A0AAW8DU25_9BURK|nr:hypothetical protein [Variovorax boronicumulans]MDP9877684.1 hypothetical protein [Variovorax boronicumulans]MDP9922968.1 hypothetical protein [Variovorax boronicumulans]